MTTPLAVADFNTYLTKLNDHLSNTKLSESIESQGDLKKIPKQLSDLRSSTSVYNKEFDERFGSSIPYSLPLFGTNQDMFLLLFYFSYAFLTLITLITLYRQTQNLGNVAYAFLISIVFFFIITAILVRVA